MSPDKKTEDLYPGAEIDINEVEKLSEAHAEWFLRMVKPLLVSFGIHMYKHGHDDAVEEEKNAR